MQDVYFNCNASEKSEEGDEDKKKKSQVPKKNSKRKGSECSRVEKKIKLNKVKKEDGMHSAKANGQTLRMIQTCPNMEKRLTTDIWNLH